MHGSRECLPLAKGWIQYGWRCRVANVSNSPSIASFFLRDALFTAPKWSQIYIYIYIVELIAWAWLCFFALLAYIAWLTPAASWKYEHVVLCALLFWECGVHLSAFVSTLCGRRILHSWIFKWLSQDSFLTVWVVCNPFGTGGWKTAMQ